MKRWREAVAVGMCGFFGIAHAQSTVTLYGILDQGIEYTTNQKGGHSIAMASGILQGSRWGFKGAEDLGGGMKAIFTLENGFDAGTGKLGQGGLEFGRQAFVGISSSTFGTLTLGRQYEEMVEYMSLASSTTQGGLVFCHAGDNDNLCLSYRVNNSIKYTSNNYAGVSFSVLYGFGGVPGQTSTNSSYSAGVNYAKGPFYLAAAVTHIRNPVTAVPEGNWSSTNVFFGSYGQNISTLDVRGIGGNYTFAGATFGLVYTHTRLEKALSQQDVTYSNYEASVSYLFTPSLRSTLAYSATRGDVYATGVRPKWDQYSFIVDYFLSKRTDVYTEGALQHARGGAPFTQIIPPFPASSSDRQAIIRVGLRTRF